MSNIKIVHVIETCSTGGAEIVVKTLLIELKRQGFDVALWVLTKINQFKPDDKKLITFEKNYIDELLENGIQIEFVGKKPKKNWLRSAIKLNQLYNKYKPNIIHTHLESVSFHVCRSLFFRRVVLIQTIHSTIIKYPEILRHLMAPRIKRFIAISDGVKTEIKKQKVKDENITVIKNGIDLKRFGCKEKIIKSDVEAIVTIGRLTKAKNHNNLIKAIRLLKDKLHSFDLQIPHTVIVGTGELLPEIKTLIDKHELQKDIVLFGVCDNIPDMLHESDIYVMSSDWEGLSISLIEALASGIPIVATDAGSNNEIIDNEVNGLLVPVADSTALAGAIFRLMKDKSLRQQFSHNAKIKSREFSIEKCALSHIQTYNELNIN